MCYALTLDGFCRTVIRNGPERNGPINGTVQPKNERNGKGTERFRRKNDRNGSKGTVIDRFERLMNGCFIKERLPNGSFYKVTVIDRFERLLPDSFNRLITGDYTVR